MLAKSVSFVSEMELSYWFANVNGDIVVRSWRITSEGPSTLSAECHKAREFCLRNVSNPLCLLAVSEPLLRRASRSSQLELQSAGLEPQIFMLPVINFELALLVP